MNVTIPVSAQSDVVQSQVIDVDAAPVCWTGRLCQILRASAAASQPASAHITNQIHRTYIPLTLACSLSAFQTLPMHLLGVVLEALLSYIHTN